MKLGKKKLLGILTAAAVVVTTVGTYAVWDTLSDTASATVDFTAPVTVTAGELVMGNEVDGEDGIPTYTGTVTFDVENKSGVTDSTKLELETKLKNPEGTAAPVGGYEVALSKGEETIGVSADTQKGSDNAVIDGANTYTITVKPTDTEAGRAMAKGGDVTVEVTGTLVAVAK